MYQKYTKITMSDAPVMLQAVLSVIIEGRKMKDGMLYCLESQIQTTSYRLATEENWNQEG